MNRSAGTYVTSTTLGEPVRAFVPRRLPPADPPLAWTAVADLNQQAELALARLSGVSGLAPSVDWLLYSAVRQIYASKARSFVMMLTPSFPRRRELRGNDKTYRSVRLSDQHWGEPRPTLAKAKFRGTAIHAAFAQGMACNAVAALHPPPALPLKGREQQPRRGGVAALSLHGVSQKGRHKACPYESQRRAGFTPPLCSFTKPGDGGVNPALRWLKRSFEERSSMRRLLRGWRALQWPHPIPTPALPP
jgi:hypothetical protein